MGELRIVKLERRPDTRPSAQRANVARDLFSLVVMRRTAPAWAFVDAMGVIERRTFAEVARRTARWSWLLRASGARPGERVVVLAGRRPEWLAGLLGAMNGGAVAVPAAGDATVDQVDELVSDSGAVLVVAGDDADPGLDAVDGAALLRLGEAEPLLAEQPTSAPTYDTGAADVALLLYGRDAHGDLRGAAHTHGSCLAQIEAGAQWLEAAAGDRLWCSAAPGSPETVCAMLAAWGRGTELIVHEGDPPPAEAAAVVDRMEIELLWLSLAEYGGLAGFERPSWLRPPRVRTAVVTDEPPDVVASDAFDRAFGAPLRYGVLRPETGILGGELPGGERHTGFPGRVLPGREPAVLDHKGRPAEPGTAGELAIRVGSLGAFAGWWDARTQRVAHPRDGWIRLGETAVLDGHGFLRPATDEEARRVAETRTADERREAAERELARQAKAAEAAARKRAEEDERRLREEAKQRERDQARQRREAEKAERARQKAEEQARKAEERRVAEQRRRDEVERARAERERAKVEERARAEEAERRAAAEAEQRLEAERAEQGRREAEEQARREAERQRQEAEERARAEQQRHETERAERARREAEEHAREVERVRLAEQQRLETERAEQARLEAEERARNDALRRAEEEQRQRLEAQRRLEADEQARREAEQRRRQEEQRVVEERRLEAARAERARTAAEERARREEERRREEAEQRRRLAPSEAEESNPSLVARIEAYTTPHRPPAPPDDGGANGGAAA